MARRIFRMCPSCGRYHERQERGAGSVDCSGRGEVIVPATVQSTSHYDSGARNSRGAREDARPELPGEQMPPGLSAIATRLTEGEKGAEGLSARAILKAIREALSRQAS